MGSSQLLPASSLGTQGPIHGWEDRVRHPTPEHLPDSWTHPSRPPAPPSKLLLVSDVFLPRAELFLRSPAGALHSQGSRFAGDYGLTSSAPLSCRRLACFWAPFLLTSLDCSSQFLRGPTDPGRGGVGPAPSQGLAGWVADDGRVHSPRSRFMSTSWPASVLLFTRQRMVPPDPGGRRGPGCR